MQCTGCKYPDSQVVYTRHDDDETIRRRRECLRCGLRFTTKESLREPQHTNDDRYPRPNRE
jgi:transcriptional repressor NrdR